MSAHTTAVSDQAARKARTLRSDAGCLNNLVNKKVICRYVPINVSWNYGDNPRNKTVLTSMNAYDVCLNKILREIAIYVSPNIPRHA